jgi:hypothetical protein
MQVISLILGLLSVLGMFIAFVPLLGWLNWLNIPFAIGGLVVGIISTSMARGNRGIGIAGIVLCSIAIIFGLLKLKACGGFI